MRIFKTKAFMKWAVNEGLDDQSLAAAVDEMEQGLVDARLGGQVYKKRVALAGRGKRGGARTLLGYQEKDLQLALNAAELIEIEVNDDE
jgi:hypothetical protein